MVDILVLGATGFTGRLVTRYLSNHPQRSSFTFAIGVRSISKGQALKKSLGLDEGVRLVQVDVTQYEDIQAAVQQAKVVLNVVGPFWLYGDPVVKACAAHGKRYVDLTGEAQFVRRIIDRYDYLATKTGAIIIPACGFDSIPADILVFLSNRTLKNALGPQAQLGLSQSFYAVRGTISGGSFATLLSDLEAVPRHKLEEARGDYALSQVRGHPSPSMALATRVPFTPRTKYAGYWIMGLTNRAIVQRSFGLNEFMASSAQTLYSAERAKEKEAQLRALTYGTQFRYVEQKVATKSCLRTAFFSVVLMSLLAFIAVFPPARWLMKRLIPKPGEGPSEKELDEGFMTVTNYTACVSSPNTWAKSVIRGKGDPGYLLTACMVSEAALALALDDASLPDAAHVGGVLTPATALGGVLVSRLEASGRLHLKSEMIRGSDESKKTR